MHKKLERYLIAGLLSISIAGGGWLRLSQLDRTSVSHPEMYVPGIPLPEGISEPAPRLSVTRVLTGTFSSDTHPPGYYLFMFPWTRIAGTSLPAIRLPSAILGTACIPLLYALGVLTVGPLAGAIAAAMLAFSGYHVFWSRVARMFALDCFLGLAATVLLLWIVRRSRPRDWWLAVYALLIVAGVATHVFFWPLFAVHMVWAFANARGRVLLPDLCRTQIAALLLGSPFLAFAAYQSATTVADLSSNASRFLAEFLQFGFVLPSDLSGFFQGPVPFAVSPWWIVKLGLILLAAGLLIAALRAVWGVTASPALARGAAGDRLWWYAVWAACAACATLAILGFVYTTRLVPAGQIHDTIAIVRRLLVMPAALALAAFLLDRYWRKLPAPGRIGSLLLGERAFLVLLAILPFAAIATASQVRPLLNQRGLLLAVPYLLLALAAGISSIPRPAAVLAILAVLCPAFAVSLRGYRDMMVDPADYAAFAAVLTREIQPADLVFVKKMWYATPILYYLPARRYRLVAHPYDAATKRDPQARVWVVLPYESEPSEEMRHALTGYRQVRTIPGDHSTAILFEPGS